MAHHLLGRLADRATVKLYLSNFISQTLSLMKVKQRWQVAWDNGNHACGVFPVIFETKRAAIAYAREWKRGMVATEKEAWLRTEARREYQWEIIPWTVHPSGRAGNSQWGW